MRFLIALTVGLAALLSWSAGAGGQANAQEEFKLGQEYVALPEPPLQAGPDDGRIEVIDFFWYGCPHCYAVEPRVAAWAAKLPPDVHFLRLPARFNDQVEFHARIFMTLENLGYGPEMDVKVFRIFLDEGRFINSPEELPGLARDLKIEPRAFTTAFNSPAVQARMETLGKLMAVYDLPGVPAMVVAGRYRFDIGTARGPEGFIRLADFLINKERRARAGR